MNADQRKPRRYRNAIKCLLADYEVEVSRELQSGTTPGRIFSKQCFARAVYYLLDHEADGAILCHGMARFGKYDSYFDHAWVELPGDVVFDGVVQMFYSREGYYRSMEVDLSRVWRYTPDEVGNLICETQHSGPWHEGS